MNLDDPYKEFEKHYVKPANPQQDRLQERKHVMRNLVSVGFLFLGATGLSFLIYAEGSTNIIIGVLGLAMVVLVLGMIRRS